MYSFNKREENDKKSLFIATYRIYTTGKQASDILITFGWSTFRLPISLTGGGRRIFLPCTPVFRFHNPDLGRLPNSRFLCAEPIGVEPCSMLLNRPTVHIHSCGKLNSRLLGTWIMTRLSGVLRTIVAKVPAAWTNIPPIPGYFSTQ